MPFDWEGRLYEYRYMGCGCGTSCYEAEALQDGAYQLVLEYELELPQNRAPYRPYDQDGLTLWSGSGLGWSNPEQEQRVAISINGSPTLSVTLSD